MVVVGGFRSNNTRELVGRCRVRGMPTYHVQGAQDLRASWFVDVETVGLTAGTSTLDETIAEVRRALRIQGFTATQTADYDVILQLEDSL